MLKKDIKINSVIFNCTLIWMICVYSDGGGMMVEKVA